MKLLPAFLILISSLLWAADKLQRLDVKLGLWETTTSGMATGELPIPADAMANMTPEQRAKIEQMMKSRMNTPSTHVHKDCLTQETLDKELSFGAARENCTHPILSSSSSGAEVKFHCAEKDGTADGTVKFEASNSENVKGKIHMTMNANGKAMTNEVNMTSRWISASCGDLK